MASNETAIAQQPEEKRSLVVAMANKYNMEPSKFLATIKATVMPSPTATNEQIAAFLAVAHEYDLNPFLKEIYAFPAKGGGIQPMVPIDGWAAIVNRQKTYDGCEFVDVLDEKNQLIAVTCKMFRKDRSHAIPVTEYMEECFITGKSTWEKWPRRMLRHKAFIQSARLAFSLSGIIDEDEAARFVEAGVIPESPSVTQRVAELRSKIAQITTASPPPLPVAAQSQGDFEKATQHHPVMSGILFSEDELQPQEQQAANEVDDGETK